MVIIYKKFKFNKNYLYYKIIYTIELILIGLS